MARFVAGPGSSDPVVDSDDPAVIRLARILGYTEDKPTKTEREPEPTRRSPGRPRKD